MPEERPTTNLEQNSEINNFREKLYISICTPNWPEHIFVEWVLNDTRILENKYPVYTFDLYRSLSEAGPWDKVNTNPLTNPFFLDEQVNLFNLFEMPLYKVVATSTNLSTPVTLVSPVQQYAHNQTGLSRRRYLDFHKIKYNRRVQLFLLNVDNFVLKRKHWGERCPDCYDEITHEVLNNKCLTCYGTSYVGGYYDPVRVLIEYSQESDNKTVTSHSYTEVNTCNIMLQNNPNILKDDLFIDTDSHHIWLVNSVDSTMMNKVTLSQTAKCSELSRDSIEYRIPIIHENALDLYKTIR